ncbi:NAD(P)H:quinone oxidoreductase [Gleimia hominis]|uniref:NAD(P)H:quinone oxidoreductase n=1 Tax=Gleimia hominis TaxID=595468 RepID=UPI000C80A73E|nr:NAD(P)H:quinone oxidoreductase [Gleimia hominis]WIK64455.1 NAD(P)H:quinone oxidoreductase [Gleimia hominis]
MTKLAVIYYSATGHGTKMAKIVEEAAKEAGADVRVRHIKETVDPEVFANNPAWTANYNATKDLPPASGEDIEWADAVIFGSPTRFSNVTGQFQSFLDTLGGLWAEGKLADKVYAAFTSSSTLHGGQETTLMKMYQSIIHMGGYIVAPGYTDPLKFTDGNPYGVGHVTGVNNDKDLPESTKAALKHMAKRVLKVANKLAQ